jgi:hypothetical protein
MSYSQHELAHFSWGAKIPKKSKKISKNLKIPSPSLNFFSKTVKK